MKWRFWLPSNPAANVSCDAIKPLLSLSCDGMASASEARLIDTHLDACGECRRALEWMQATQLVISNRPPVPPPPDLRLRIAQAIAQTEQATRLSRPVRRPVVLRPVFLTAAVAATVAACGVLIQNSLPTPKPAIAIYPSSGTRVSAKQAGAPGLTAHGEARQPAERPHIAAVPQSALEGARPAKAHAQGVARVVRALPTPLGDVRPVAGGIAVPRPRSLTKPAPLPQVQMAAGPRNSPSRNDTPPAPRNIVIAALPKAYKTNASVGDPAGTPPELAPQSPSVEAVRGPEAVHTEAPRVAVALPGVLRSAQGDVLSNVRASLASLKSATTRKLYRNSVARVQANAYTSDSSGGSADGFAPIVLHTNYTPGLNDKPEPQRASNGTEQN